METVGAGIHPAETGRAGHAIRRAEAYAEGVRSVPGRESPGGRRGETSAARAKVGPGL